MLEGVLVGAFDDDQIVVGPVRANLLHQVTEARDLEHIRLKLVAERRHLLIIGLNDEAAVSRAESALIT